MELCARAPTRRSGLSRRTFLRLLAAGGSAAALVGCRSSSARPPSGDATAAAPPGWNELVERAGQEGKVVVSGPANATTRTELPAAFKRRFGVELEYLAVNTGELMTRLQSERAAGQYTLDAMLAGAQSLYLVGYPERMFDPLPPALIHPEATDPRRWVSGHPWYMDPEQQYILRVSNYAGLNVWVNTQHVQPGELTSWSELLAPRYRGKISVWEPTVPGTGWLTATYLRRQLGDDFIRGLYRDQQPAVSRDNRQLADWMARGSYPISLGLSPADAEQLKADGFPLAVAMQDLPEAPGFVTAGFGLTALLNRAPHPHAARLFLNWIAMREGQEAWNRSQRTPGTRTDLDNAWAPPYVVPQPGVHYFDSYEWDYQVSGRTPETIEQMRALTGRDTPT